MINLVLVVMFTTIILLIMTTRIPPNINDDDLYKDVDDVSIDPDLIEYLDLDHLSKLHADGCLHCIDKSDRKCYNCPNYIFN